MEKRLKQSIRKTFSLALVLALVITFVLPINVEAKTKTLTLKPADVSDIYLSYVDKVTTNINKTGTYKIVQKKSKSVYHGYVKFTAPKTKTYTITLSNLKCKGNEDVYGGVNLYFAGQNETLCATCAKSKGESTSVLSFSHKNKGGSLISKRVGKIKLNKGQSLYMLYGFIVKTKGKKLTSTLQIK